ncbi:hypothetical protein B0T19DRAFT_406675 [Cercophora scortea]|uniref:Uncharacterized protein n=1 Tax=Cercophora scortea TaxID=314031 RepID=A0AAE0J282_9PEZI|nr:hypothetical protein B0T19DRAFT_406675 [Cercophora scortea]
MKWTNGKLPSLETEPRRKIEPRFDENVIMQPAGPKNAKARQPTLQQPPAPLQPQTQTQRSPFSHHPTVVQRQPQRQVFLRIQKSNTRFHFSFSSLPRRAASGEWAVMTSDHHPLTHPPIHQPCTSHNPSLLCSKHETPESGQSTHCGQAARNADCDEMQPPFVLFRVRHRSEDVRNATSQSRNELDTTRQPARESLTGLMMDPQLQVKLVA